MTFHHTTKGMLLFTNISIIGHKKGPAPEAAGPVGETAARRPDDQSYSPPRVVESENTKRPRLRGLVFMSLPST